MRKFQVKIEIKNIGEVGNKTIELENSSQLLITRDKYGVTSYIKIFTRK